MRPIGGNIAATGINTSTNQEQGLRLVSPQELNERAAAHEAAQKRQNAPIIIGISSFLETAWQSARQAKEVIERELLRDIRQRRGEYDPDELALIREQGGSEIFMLLTAEKVRSLKSLIRDIMVQPDEKAWGLEPTPIADLPPHIEQNIKAQLQHEVVLAAQQAGKQIPPEAIEAAFNQMHDTVKSEMQEQASMASERMEEKIADQFEDGGFPDAFEEFIDDFCTYKTAFVAGPLLRNKKSLKWQQLDGDFIPVAGRNIVKEAQRVSPFDVYPSPDASGVDDGYHFIRDKFSVSTLNDMKGVPGYDEEAINEVIAEYGRGGLRNWLAHDYERAVAEGKPYEYLHPSTKIEGLHYWGEAPGFMLLEWGMDADKIPDLNMNYQIHAIKIGRWVIRAAINPHPLGNRPLYAASFDRPSGVFWGNSLPETIRDDQKMCNGAARALSNNMGIASGPQVVINDINRLPQGADVTNLYPWKIWQFTGDDFGTSHKPPLEFYQPEALVNELLALIETYRKLADEHSSIPNYMTDGPAASGAGKTASGLSMLMGQASKGIKRVIGEIDTNIIKKIVEAYYIHEMMYGKDKTVKGDLRCVARGSTALLVKEQQQVRRLEFLQMTNNPTDLQIMGLPGRARILRRVAESLEIPLDDVVPDPDDTMARNENAALLLSGQQPVTAGQETPQILGADGHPISGQDTNTFQQPSSTGGMQL